jgi:hypothetical protein
MDVNGVAVDTGFIVYNEATYPNFSALLDHLGVATQTSDMTSAISLDDGRLEYSGTGLTGLFAQPRNAVSFRFWGMLRDLLRFYREAPHTAIDMGDISLDAYLDASGTAFRVDHLYPMAAAIWSTPAAEIGEYPARAFVRFCENHGLLRLVKPRLCRQARRSDSRNSHEHPYLCCPPTFGQRGGCVGGRRGPAFRPDRPRDARRPSARDAGRPKARGGAAAWRIWLLREQRHAPFRRNSDAASTLRVVELELSVERAREQSATRGQLLDEPSSRAAEREADVFDLECAPTSP